MNEQCKNGLQDKMESFGLYIHVPFCRSRCGYCDFPTRAVRRLPRTRYLRAVLAELDARGTLVEGFALRSIYIGGGTPSLLDPEAVATLIERVRERFHPPSGIEVTLEVNPGDATAPTFRDLRAAGVNRLSLGVQILDDVRLKALGRRHDAASARRAVGLARLAGFDNISVDLLFALPGQTVPDHLEQLRRLIALEPEHLSTYALSLAPTSPMARAGITALPDERQLAMMEQGREVLEAAGFVHYEVSNYARPGRRSQHNSGVWQGWPYLGLGPFAHSMVPHGAATLRCASPDIEAYLRGWLGTGERPWRSNGWPGLPPGGQAEVVQGDAARLEQLFLGLRTVLGVDRVAFARRFGQDPARADHPSLPRLLASGWLLLTPSHLRPSRQGIWLADELALRLSDGPP